MIDLGLAAASIVVLVALLFLYGSNFRTLRSPLSLGLIIFAALFLVENLAAIYFYVSLNETLTGTAFGASVAMPMLVLNTVELIGLTTLFYVSWR
ncbi:MAG: hypothetical protein ACREDF_05860 [Thermoplasmata archaeon]